MLMPMTLIPMTSLIHQRSARSPAGFVAMALGLALLAGLWAIGAHWFVLVLLALPLVLLGLDLLRDTPSRFELSQTHLIFAHGNQKIALPLAEIDKIRLNRRLDFSWRVTVLMTDGRKFRLPPPCIPPMDAFEQALASRDVRQEKVLFAFVG